MITKKVLAADRIRCIDGGFSFIPHRFLSDGFLEALSQQQLLLYIFLVLAAARNTKLGVIKKIMGGLMECKIFEFENLLHPVNITVSPIQLNPIY